MSLRIRGPHWPLLVFVGVRLHLTRYYHPVLAGKLVVGLPIFLIGTVLLADAVRRVLRGLRFRRHGLRTTGTVIGHKRGTDDGYLIVRFEDHQGNGITFTSEVYRSTRSIRSVAGSRFSTYRTKPTMPR